MSRRQLDLMSRHNTRMTVYSRKIDSVDPANHFTPHIGIDSPVKLQTFLGS